MAPKIGPFFGGRTLRSSLRSGQRAPLRFETLEPRLLMAGDTSWLTSNQVPSPPAQVATAQSVIPANLNIPGGNSTVPVLAWPFGDQQQSGVLSPGGIALYQLSSAPGAEILQLNLTIGTLPAGASVQLLAVSDAGDVLINSSQITVPQSSTVTLSVAASVSIPDGVAYVGILVAGPSGSTADAPDIAYNLEVTTDPIATPAVVGTGNDGSSGNSSDVPAGNTATASETFSESVGIAYALGTQSDGAGPSQTSQGTGGPTGPGSSGAGQPTTSQQGAPTTSPSPPPAVAVGAVKTTAATLNGRDAPGAPSPIAPIDVGPLPASEYEPAAGIFSVGVPVERVDQVEATYVEMPLVRLTAEPQTAPHDDRSSEQWAGIRTSVPLDTATDRTRDLDVTVVPMPSGNPAPLRPGSGSIPLAASATTRREVETVDGRSVALSPALPVPPVTDELVWGGLLASAATLPAIDEYNHHLDSATRVNPRSDGTTDEDSPEWESRQAVAIVLGLSGSAALGVSLYAPDLTVAVRRAVRAPAPQRRRGPATSRDDRAR
jgi:hypothetical protein